MARADYENDETGLARRVESLETTFAGMEGLQYISRQVMQGLGPNLQAVFRFANGYGASVIYSQYSYGVEMATVLYSQEQPTGDPVWDYENQSNLVAGVLEPEEGSGDGIYGWNTPEELVRRLNALRDLPSPYNVLEEGSHEHEVIEVREVGGPRLGLPQADGEVS